MSLKKLFAVIFSMALLLSLTAFSVSAEGGRVIDQVGLFTEQERAELNRAIDEAEKKSDGVRYFIVTEKNLYADKERLMRLCGASETDDVCILSVKISAEYSQRYYDFYTNGLATKRISDSEVDDILDDPAVFENLRYDNAAAGVLRFLEITPDAIAVPYLTIILIAVFAGLTGAGIAVAAVVSTYKKKMRSTNYPLDKYARLDLTGNEDQFIGKHVSVVITSSGGSGGGRSGGGFGGGGGGARGSR